MTIAQMAQELNITRQAINNRLRRAGITMAEIAERQGTVWQLTDEGARIIRDMMRGEPNEKVKKLQAAQRMGEEQAAKDEAQAEQLRQVNQELEKLKEQRAEDQKIINQQAGRMRTLEQMIDQQAGMVQTLEKTIDQQAHMMQTLEKTIEKQADMLEGLNKSIQAQAMAAAAHHIAAARENVQPVGEVEITEPAQTGEGQAAREDVQPVGEVEITEPAQTGEGSAAREDVQPVRHATGGPGLWARFISRISRGRHE